MDLRSFQYLSSVCKIIDVCWVFNHDAPFPFLHSPIPSSVQYWLQRISENQTVIVYKVLLHFIFTLTPWFPEGQKLYLDILKLLIVFISIQLDHVGVFFFSLFLPLRKLHTTSPTYCYLLYLKQLRVPNIEYECITQPFLGTLLK